MLVAIYLLLVVTVHSDLSVWLLIFLHVEHRLVCNHSLFKSHSKQTRLPSQFCGSQYIFLYLTSCLQNSSLGINWSLIQVKLLSECIHGDAKEQIVQGVAVVTLQEFCNCTRYVWLYPPCLSSHPLHHHLSTSYVLAVWLVLFLPTESAQGLQYEHGCRAIYGSMIFYQDPVLEKNRFCLS